MKYYNKSVFGSLILLFTFIIYSSDLRAQFNYYERQDVVLTENGRELSLPWSGGINSGQFNTMDANGDGIEDLIVFDKTSYQIKVFLYLNNQYTYAPDYALLFPRNLTGWVIIKDINCDGKKDLFTWHPLGIKVYINTTLPSSPLSWRSYNEGKALETLSVNGIVNIKVNEGDIPSIEDVDFDGDIDIIVYTYLGNTLQLQENKSTNCDTLFFEKTSDRYGDFEECGCGLFGYDKTCAELGGRVEHVSDRALLSLDMDGDLDMDMIISEEGCNYMFLLENIGTATAPIFRNSTSNFPNTVDPVSIFTYPAAHYVDVYNDGKKDLIVSPNTRSNISRGMNFTESVSFYQNNSSNLVPDFHLQKRNFLQDEMLDLGSNAVPAFFDIDNDGDLDMFIGWFGNYYNTGRRASLYLFENTGTPISPRFELKSNDMFGLAGLNLFNIKPQFIDLNQDGNIDFTFTATDAGNFRSNIFYILNNSFWGMDFSNSYLKNLPISLSIDESVFFYDIDGDDLVDLLVGKSAGNLEYYKNYGTPDNPDFQLESNAFYDLGYDITRLYPIPKVLDLNNNDIPELIISNWEGKTDVFPDFLSDLQTPVPPDSLTAFNQLTTLFQNTSFGSLLHFTNANIFGEDIPALIIGSAQGGIHILQNSTAKTIWENANTTINP
ncbi:MAG: FG-GAP-like repeat-containing protein, partial [Cyclobacteriaceae bacterium]|nr:FG-GAP-like repeat-containing protein [Cyclobacteriaceae bacterium]